MRTVRPHFQRGDGVLEVVNRTRRRSEMQYAVERARDVRVGRDVVAHELEAFVADQVREVVRVPGDEVVESHHVMPVANETVGKVGTEEPGGPRDEHSHARGRPNERYLKPSAVIFSGVYRFRPSMMTGCRRACFIRWKSGW